MNFWSFYQSSSTIRMAVIVRNLIHTIFCF